MTGNFWLPALSAVAGLLLCMAVTSATLTPRDNVITAYDCAAPQTIEDRALDRGGLKCEEQTKSKTIEKDREFQLLVDETVQVVQGQRCEILMSRTVSYCGNYDHQTLVSKFNFYNMPRPPTADECRSMFSTMSYTMPNGAKVKLAMGSTPATYQAVGRTFTSSGGAEVECEGGVFEEDGQRLEEIIVDIALIITLSHEDVRHANGVTIAMGDSTRLPCSIFRESCQTSEATLLWKHDPDYCSLGVSKHVKGMLVTDNHDQQVFMSTDGSLVRLVLKYQESACDRQVWATNYDNLFLAPIPSRNPFRRSIIPESISMSTYVNNRDDFIYSYLVEQIDEEMNDVLMHDCEEMSKRTRQDYFLKHEHPGIVTFILGNGTFATTAGEVLYFYQCRPVAVRAVEHVECFDHLPVQRLPSSDPATADAQARTSTNTEAPDSSAPSEFLHPLTHRLTKFASRLPCTKTFPAKYRLDGGKWITVDPHLREAPPPRDMESPKAILVSINRELDPSHGGVYDQHQLEQLETLLTLQAARDAFTNQLTRQTSYETGRGYVSPSEMFQVHMSAGWFDGFVAGFLDFLDIWGKTAAICTSIYVAYQMIKSLFECVYGGKALHERMGCTAGLLWLLCPSTWLLRQFNSRNAGTANQENDIPLRPISHEENPSSGTGGGALAQAAAPATPAAGINPVDAATPSNLAVPMTPRPGILRAQVARGDGTYRPPVNQ